MNSKTTSIKKIVSLLLALMMVIMYAIPQGAEDAHAAGDGERVKYTRGDVASGTERYKWVDDGGGDDAAYCINHALNTSSKDTFGQRGLDYRLKYRWGTSWAGTTIEKFIFNQNKNGDNGVTKEQIARVLYAGYNHNGAGLRTTENDGQFYVATQDAVFRLTGQNGVAGTGVTKTLADKILAQANNPTVPLPANYEVYVYFADKKLNGEVHWQSLINLEFKEEEKWKIGTTANVEGKGSAKAGEPLTIDIPKGKTSTGGLTISDTIKYENLPAGNYSVKTQLVKVNPDGSTTVVRNRSSEGDGFIGGFTPNASGTGTWNNANTTMWGVDLTPGTYVFFEQVRREATGYVVKHEDVNNKEQTIIVKEPEDEKVVQPIDLNFQLSKELTGKALQDTMFEFKLTGANQSGSEITYGSRLTNAEGKLRNPLSIKVRQPGTYTYEIWETQGRPNSSTVDYDEYPGIKYSSKRVTLKITVVNNNGTLKATVKADGNDVAPSNGVYDITGAAGAFTNTYTEPSPVHALVQLKKSITGNAELTEYPEFKFLLSKADEQEGSEIINGARWTKPTGQHELYNPFNIKFTKAGTYRFKIEEDKTASGKSSKSDYTGIGFTAADREIEVTVVKSGGELQVESISGANLEGNAWVLSEAFVNTYNREYVQVNVSKVWKDANGTNLEWPGDVNEVQVLVEYGNDSETITLSKLEPSKPSKLFTKVEGERFVVTELTAVGGYTDSITNTENNYVITNTKQEPDKPVEIKLNLKKALTGDTFSGDKYPEFCFVVTPEEEYPGVTVTGGNDRVPGGRWSRHSGNHELWNPFLIKFENPGTYNFTVSEVKTDAGKHLDKYDYAGIDFDAEDKQVTVKIGKDDQSVLFVEGVTGLNRSGSEYVVTESFENTYHAPKLGTTASDKNDSDKYVASEGDVEIKDVVKYDNLKPETEYTLSATLHKKTTVYNENDGMEVIWDGGTVEHKKAVVEGTNGLKFTTPASPDGKTYVSGEVNVIFTVDAAEVAGQVLVAFEEVSRNGSTIVTHANIKDEAQTVYVPYIGTTATANGKHVVDGNNEGSVTINDLVEYSGLKPNTAYRLSGQLHKKSDGQAIGTPKDVEFTTNGYGVGTQTVEFVLTAEEAVSLKGDAVVAFEKVFENDSPSDSEVASHEDINDTDQTVEFETKKHEVLISKQDLGGKELPGATIKVTTKNDETVEAGEWVSTEEPHKLQLEAGEYKMEERVSPSGYRPVTTIIEFTVDNDGKVTLKSEKVDNGGKITVSDGNHIKLQDSPMNGKLRTTVTAGGKSGSDKEPVTLNESAAKAVTEVKDKIDYEGFVKGDTYVVTGRLMDVTDPADLQEVATATEEKVAEDKSGSWDITFKNVSLKAGRKYVVFEYAENKENSEDTGEHRDVNDKAQTIVVVTDGDESAIIAVKKTAQVTEVTAGDEIPYTISVTNTGTGKATRVDLRDTMGKYLSYVSDDSNGTLVGNNMVDWVVDVPAGETVEITINCKISEKAAGRVVNNVKIMNPEIFGSVTEESDRALVNLDGEDEEDTDTADTTGGTSGSNGGHGVKTGDESMLGLWVLLALTSALGLALRKHLMKR